MNTITRFMTDDIIHAAGWTLLHSIWQGMAIALLLALALLALRRRSPQVRYLAGLAAMGALMAAAVLTFFAVYAPGVAPAGAVQDATANAGPAVALNEEMNGAPSAWGTVTFYFNQHLPLLVFFWLMGVLVVTLRTAGELVYLQHLRYNRSKPAGLSWQEHLQELARRMKVGTEVQLRESRRIHSPMVIGFIKPVILVPVGLLVSLPPEQVESALVHELAHIRRHDYLVNLLQSMIETLFFFNPALWWISAQVRAEREHCCDDWAVALTGDELTFVKTLATLEEYRMRHTGLVVGLAGSQGSVLGRIQRLVDGRQSQRVPFRAFWSVAVLLLFLGMAAFTSHPGRSEGPVLKPKKTKIEITRLDTMPPSDMPEGMALTEASIPSETKTEPLPRGSVAEEKAAAPTETPAAGMKASISVDTIPESDKERRQKMMQLERQVRERQLKIENQQLQLEEKMNALKQEAQMAQNVRETKMLELKEKAQRLRNEVELKQEELQLKESELRNQVTEVEGALQELEMTLREEKSKESPDPERLKSLEEDWKALQKRKLELHKQANQAELEQKKAAFEIQKQLRALQELQWVSQREDQTKQNEQQLLLMKLQQQYQKLTTEQQMLKNEYQLKMLELQKEQSN